MSDLAVPQEQPAVLVEVADVADGEELRRGGSPRSSPCPCGTRSRRCCIDMYTVPISPGGTALPASSRTTTSRDRPRLARPCPASSATPRRTRSSRRPRWPRSTRRSTGPHHSIIWRLIVGGHGAAACTMCRSDDTSYCAFTSSGSASRRWNCVGTMWLFVTPYFSMSCSMRSGVHLSISTTVWPTCSAPPANTSTAVW